MKVSGLCIIKNGIRLDYPYVEAIRSALPICDEFVVVVGKSLDGTRKAVEKIGDPKIRIVDTIWSKKVTPRKCLLAQQTNIGLHLCTGDWVVYLQGNEVLHEKSLPDLRRLMQKYRKDLGVEALLLERLHFWGDYRHIVTVYPSRFKYSPRIIRPYIGTYSIRDAMSFAVFDHFSTRGRYPRAVDTGHYLFRYGAVRTPELMTRKFQEAVHSTASFPVAGDFFFQALPKAFIKPFLGSHPQVMTSRIASFKQKISLHDPRWRTRMSTEEKLRLWETCFYHRFGIPRWRNKRYRLVGAYRRKPHPSLAYA